MKRHQFWTLLASASLLVLSGCSAIVGIWPPGNSVYVTDQQSEIATCTPMGNIKLVEEGRDADRSPPSEAEFRYRVAELGGNTGLVVSGSLHRPLEGVAFRCGYRAA